MNNAQVHAILNVCLEKLKATRHYSQHHVDLLMAKLTIELNDRMRTRGGSCRWTHLNGTVLTVGIRLCSVFFERATAEQQYNTISHEFAHAYELILTGGETSHGARWQSIHRAMGGNAERCHTVEMVRNKVKRHTLVNVLTGQIYNNVSTRMVNKCKRTNQILGYVKYKVEGYRTV